MLPKLIDQIYCKINVKTLCQNLLPERIAKIQAES